MAASTGSDTKARPPISGDHLDAPVTWGATARISAPSYSPVVLRFKLRQATLFGFEDVA